MLQLAIIIIYFVVTILIGNLASKGTDTSSKFHGTRLGVAAIIFVSAGEWLGGTSTTGVSEWGFNYGISGTWYTIANGIGVMFFALCFAKLYRSIGKMTVSGIIETIFGKSAQVISGVILVFVMIAVGIVSIMAAGKFGQALLGLDYKISTTLFTILFLIYTLAGGMKAVSSTNTIHVITMYAGMIVAVLILLYGLGGWNGFLEGIRSAEAGGSAKYFSMTSIGWSKVSSWLLASVLGACTAQAGIQPVFAAKDVPTARRACILTALLIAPFGVLTALIGMIAKVMANQGILTDAAGAALTDGKLALTSVIMSLPPAVGGIILAAQFAAILSTASPIMLAAGTLLTKDVYQVCIDRHADDKKILLVSRICTAGAGVLCCLGAIFLADNNSALDIVYSAYSLRGALFIVILFGLFCKRATPGAACTSMIITFLVSVFWVVYKVAFGSYPIVGWFTETYAAILAAVITMVAAMTVTGKTGNQNQKRWM